MVDAADHTLLSVVSLFLLIPSKMVSGMEPRGDELVFTLEHCLTEGADASFLPRGSIFVKSLKSLSATFSQREPLSPSELDKLRDLASRNGHYRIRLQPKSGQDNSDASDGSVTTVVKACALFASQFTETITLSLDNTGHLYGVGLIVPDRGCHLKTLNWDSASLPSYFNTSVSVVLQGTGQLPDTQTYIQKMEREKREKATGKTQDNRSFLAKYWMYIVPVVIVMMLSSQPPENQGEGGGQ